MLKVLLNDGLEKEGLDLLHEAGIETDTKKREPQMLLAEIGEFDALIVRSATKVTREVLEAGARYFLLPGAHRGPQQDRLRSGPMRLGQVVVALHLL